MAPPAPPNDIILYHYPFSPYARRVIWYLQLRGIGYGQCIQPPTLPRPDLAALGVRYRRIPLLAIGRDVYCDTRLILRKLEQRFPDGALGARNGDQKAIERLLEKFTVDAGVFNSASALIPPELLVMKDSRFQKDREELSGRSWNAEDVKKGRPEALVNVREGFELLETTLLADGRDWVLKTDKPTLADIEAIWPFHWLVEMKGALPPNVISESRFPKVYAWIARFRAALQAAKAAAPKPVTLKGPEAAQHITEARFAEEPNGASVDAEDPLGLEKGDVVEVWPIDSGSRHHDRGRLVTLNANEVTVSSRCEADGRKEVHIHTPRWGFRVAKGSGDAGAKL
ncbi:glutathione S-transferase [Lineolata rhizophorae]|uniref:Glutathione S-transferase n=1 Tax=Lineolata rhizophorae TaxID=578093 RepID=A0A6A6NRE2_9PEZI|nr:glutathione S-transferase [Lineolata rhizophorae]